MLESVVSAVARGVILSSVSAASNPNRIGDGSPHIIAVERSDPTLSIPTTLTDYPTLFKDRHIIRSTMEYPINRRFVFGNEDNDNFGNNELIFSLS